MVQNKLHNRKSGLANSDNAESHVGWVRCKRDGGGACHTAHACATDTGADASAWGVGDLRLCTCGTFSWRDGRYHIVTWHGNVVVVHEVMRVSTFRWSRINRQSYCGNMT